jgi:hypothetical protein
MNFFSNIHLKPPGIFQFFHETTSGSLNLFFKKNQIPRLNSTLPSLLNALQIGRTCPQKSFMPT